MRILVLGGTQFLSREIVRQAMDAGHDVTAAARGTSGDLPPGAAFIRWDRTEDAPRELLTAHWDAIVDVARIPSLVERAVAQLEAAHWVLVSTISVYADASEPGATADAPTLDPVRDRDVDDPSAGALYGPMKVACEQLVRERTASSGILRPGLIVGPGDPSGRFAYWPAHAAAASADGHPLLIPGSADDAVQVIDVRDLAAFTLLAAERRLTGTFDATGPRMTRAAFTAAAAEGVGAPDLATQYVASDELERLGVGQWNGTDSIPVWVDDPSMAGFMARDVSASLDVGLVIRRLAETVRDTLAWLRATPDAVVGGIPRARELEVLAAAGDD